MVAYNFLIQGSLIAFALIETRFFQSCCTVYWQRHKSNAKFKIQVK